MLRRFLLVFLFVLCAAPAFAELRIDVTSGQSQPLPIAVNDFTGNDVGKQISDVVTADLQRSGLFRPIPSSSFIERGLAVDATPRFADWKAINSQAVVVGRVSPDGSGNLTVEFRLWDVLAQGQMIGRRFTTTQGNWRQLAHMIADAIYSRLTGEKGYFNTRIVFVAESGPFNKRIKRLAIMDQDGANMRYLTDGSAMVLTPRFSPSEQQIAYMSFEGKPAVYIYNLSQGARQRLGDFPGMTFSPRFSPDGHSVVMSLARNGNTDIYRMDLGTRHMNQLTHDPTIETAPSYSPDGSKIAFESDRSGTQQIYVMNADGSGIKRITFGQGRYAGPVWSPRGDLIAFTRLNVPGSGGQFYIGVIRPDGTGERMITAASHVEGPTWAPNGRVLMYFKETPSGDGRYSRLYTIDLTGANEQAVDLPTSASDPAWSPHLQ